MDFLSNICVRAPYFALHDLLHDGLQQTATISPEQIGRHEQGPIRAAEAGRHLAILGLCSLASTNPQPGRHYYLAQSAHLRRVTKDTEDPQLLRATAVGSWHNARQASAKMELFGNNGAVFQLDVTYSVLKEKLFERLFREHFSLSDEIVSTNPYRTGQELTSIEISHDAIKAHLGTVQPKWCVGHFKNYPALPVAIVMGSLVDLAECLLQHLVGHTQFRYVVTDAEIRADNLAFAGDVVELHASVIHSDGNRFVFQCEASTTKGKSVGNMLLTLIC